jgi:hypothetical protein
VKAWYLSPGNVSPPVKDPRLKYITPSVASSRKILRSSKESREPKLKKALKI